ncbi:MAG: hypothetical protein ACHQ2Z_16600 [Elusimicrobiota bacterium]
MNADNRLLPTFAVAGVCLAAGLAAAAAAHWTTRSLVNEGVFLKNYRPVFWEESLLYHKMDYVLTTSESNDVLLLGDSTCLMDLDTLRLTRATGRTAYNLGTLGSLGSDGHLQILRDYLRRHPKPRFLVYTIWPAELTAGSHADEGVKDRFIWTYGPELRAERGLKRWPLDFRLREELRTMAGLVAERRTRPFEREVAPGITHARLGELLRERRGFFERTTAIAVEAYAGDLRVEPVLGARFEELLSFADAQGLRVLVRLAPMPAGISDARKEELADWFARLKTGPNVIVARPLVLEFPPSEFTDWGHLNASGVRRLTDLVASELKHE